VGLLRRLSDPDDHSAWTSFVARYQPPIWRTARRAGLSEADAEEVVQRTFIAVHRSLASYSPQLSRFRTWLGGIVRRRIHEVLREVRGRPEAAGLDPDFCPEREPLPEDLPGEPYPPFEEEAERELDARAWERLKGELRPVHWQVLYELVVRGQSPGEVARKYGLSRGYVYVIKWRGLPQLRAVREQLELKDEQGLQRAGEGGAGSPGPGGSGDPAKDG
jgi:RNA polymerase sigma-70 factor (ECF subfamily)